MYYPFNPRNPLYKSKFGAVASGESLRLRLLLHFDARVYDAFLLLRKDGCETQQIKLTPQDTIDEYRIYECEISLDEGLYFYRFYYTSEYGTMNVTADEHKVGTVSSGGGWWQLTCYESGFKTPDWLKGGIIYQIFPDRFCCSGKEKKNVPDDRFLVEEWASMPEYRQNNGPCSLGNDYFGGDLQGIIEKLPYLEKLGVSCIYLNPIFEAHSNHRYNTADYLKIDPLLGEEKDLENLCEEAGKHGINIILDGVFSHTGDDSLYFNKYGRYESVGAYNDASSPYISWFKFKNWPDSYHSWWGVSTLPETVEENESFDRFITGEEGVIRYWMKKGVKGWRLDVADELPDSILDNIRTAIKKQDPDGFLLGEVWENATNKISYGVRRRYLRGRQLDSVMNYPFASAIIRYVCGGDGKDFLESICEILEDYPAQAIHVLMNHLGTHDTARILTMLGTNNYPSSRAEQAQASLSAEEYKTAVKRLKLASLIQYTLPGVPSLYYGDEAGLQGYGDPFCRATYPWGNENNEIFDFYTFLGQFRRENDVFAEGGFEPLVGGLGTLAYIRYNDDYKLLIATNRWHDTDFINIPAEFDTGEIVAGNRPNNGVLELDAMGFAIIKLQNNK